MSFMNKLIFLSLFGFSTLLSHYHEPGVEFVFDDLLNKEMFSQVGGVHMSLFHQSSIELENDHVVILHVLTNPYSHTKHHSEIGVGYRKLYDSWGFGLNFVHASSNLFGPHNHQFCPGIELSYGHFDLAYNRYFPLNQKMKYEKAVLDFHEVSELSISYKPSRKYEFSIAPYFNHQTKKTGITSGVSAYVFDDWKVSINPFFDPKSGKGVSMSLGFHFGGAKKKVNRLLTKSHRFYSNSHIPVAGIKATPIQPIFTTEGPMVLPPPEVKEEVDPPKPDIKKSWWDYLFFWRSKGR